MSQPTKIHLLPSTMDDIGNVRALIVALSRWLRSKGISQWSESFPLEILKSEVEKGELYVLHENSDLIASVALTMTADEFWDDDDGTSLYLHRLAIARDRSGENLGAAIMKWAEQKASSAQFRSLRLICDATNPFLPGYYASLGYESRGQRHYAPWNMTFAKFEKILQ